MNAFRRLAVLPIRFYQRYLSPLKPPTCRFHPTCSAYTYGAILRHGFIKGWLLGIWRILRCQPFSDGGFDPIPEVGRWRADPEREPPDSPDEAGSREEKRG